MDAAGAGPVAQRLREAGLRATEPRRLVLEAVERIGGHVSADDVAAELQARGEHLARQSVYNALAALTAAGLVRVTDLRGGARYEPAGEPHHHLVCRVCGRVIDVEGPPVTLDVPGAVVESASIVFRGVCADCRPG